MDNSTHKGINDVMCDSQRVLTQDVKFTSESLDKTTRYDRDCTS